MNAFKRLGDIISANINSALEKAENPEKMIDLSIRKLEDTRTELRKTIAEKSAERNSYERKSQDEREAAMRWEKRARLAISRGKDEMAKEAVEAELDMKRAAESDKETAASLSSVISSLSETLSKVESKMEEMKAKSAELKARAKGARERIRANETMEKASGAKWSARFEELSTRIEKWEREAELSGNTIKTEPDFESLERDEEIEKEITRIKEEMRDNA